MRVGDILRLTAFEVDWKSACKAYFVEAQRGEMLCVAYFRWDVTTHEIVGREICNEESTRCE